MTSTPNRDAARQLLVAVPPASSSAAVSSAIVEILPRAQSRGEMGRADEMRASDPVTSGQMLNDLARTLTTAVAGADDVSLDIDADREGGIHIKLRTYRRGG